MGSLNENQVKPLSKNSCTSYDIESNDMQQTWIVKGRKREMGEQKIQHHFNTFSSSSWSASSCTLDWYLIEMIIIYIYMMLQLNYMAAPDWQQGQGEGAISHGSSEEYMGDDARSSKPLSGAVTWTDILLSLWPWFLLLLLQFMLHVRNSCLNLKPFDACKMQGNCNRRKAFSNLNIIIIIMPWWWYLICICACISFKWHLHTIV